MFDFPSRGKNLPQAIFLPQKMFGVTKRVHTKGGHATTCFLEKFLEASLKEVLLRRVLRRHLVRASVGTRVLRKVKGS